MPAVVTFEVPNRSVGEGELVTLTITHGESHSVELSKAASLCAVNFLTTFIEAVTIEFVVIDALSSPEVVEQLLAEAFPPEDGGEA